MALSSSTESRLGVPGTPAFCSIIAKNYLAQARALTRSLRRHHPDMPVYVLVVDDTTGWFDASREDFRLVTLEDLAPPAPAELCFRYELLELCTAVKPLFLTWLLARGHPKIVFLDPDVWVYRPLFDLLALLDDWDVVLTPHLTARVDDGRYPDERLMLLVGAYNLGFLALTAGPPVRGLLEWWWARCERHCLFERERGYFLDQKWMNLAPGMIDRLLVLRHPGYNVAHWNFNHRRLAGPAAAPLVNGEPLYFLHGSSVDPLDPPRLACPQTRYGRIDGEPLTSMLREYSAELIAGGYQVCRHWPYTHAVFDDGHPIGREMRRLLRELPAGTFPEPFRTVGAGTFRQWAVGAAVAAVADPPRAPPAASAPSPASSQGRRWRGPARESRARRDGATVAGYLHAESGMGELARGVVRALGACGYPVSPLELRDLAHRHGDASLRNLAAPAAQPFAVIALTAPDAARERDRTGPARAGAYAIGYWPWELESFPDDLGDVFAGFDEVWALSRFSADAIARASPVPVHAVWPALPDVDLVAAGPRDVLLDPSEHNFLFIYDLLSETDRKNPLALIEAFRLAFRRPDRARLTIKTINGEMRKDELRAMEDAAYGLRITLLDRYLARPHLLRLLRECDGYVSLHRAEGFGFTLVEAMALGKPVIATNYSANTEYMTPWNSLPVPYRMGEVRVRRGAYAPGSAWAEADVPAAAESLRALYNDPDLGRHVGRQAQADVRAQLAAAACGRRMVRRLRAIRSGEPDRADIPHPASAP